MTGLDPKMALLIALAVFTVFYLVILAGAVQKELARGASLGSILWGPKSPALYFTGAFTNFWDTLGVGSFAPTTAIFRAWKLVPDERIPGTLNIGHTLPTIIQAFIFTKIVEVEPWTLVYMILAAVIGSYVGSGLVAGWPRQRVQAVMGSVLLIGGAVMLMRTVNFMPAGGDAIALTGMNLALGVLGNFVLGALMTIGVGLYGPCMVLIFLLGMSPKVAFPIMMGSCAFLMPVASYRFVKKDFFDLRAALALGLGGVPMVLVAVYIVKTLPITVMSYLVVAVVLYTSYGLLKSSREKTLAPIEDGIAPSPVP
ncbi:MAG: sulfite exporter TauE/SafE family protein [Gemmatimonadaceae bacterium]